MADGEAAVPDDDEEEDREAEDEAADEDGADEADDEEDREAEELKKKNAEGVSLPPRCTKVSRIDSRGGCGRRGGRGSGARRGGAWGSATACRRLAEAARAALVDSDWRGSGGSTSRVTDGDGHLSAGCNVDGPGKRGASLLVEGLESLRDLASGGDSWEVWSLSTGPGDLDWLALDEGGWGVDSELALCQSNAGGGEGGEGEGNCGELHRDGFGDGKRLEYNGL